MTKTHSFFTLLSNLNFNYANWNYEIWMQSVHLSMGKNVKNYNYNIEEPENSAHSFAYLKLFFYI